MIIKKYIVSDMKEALIRAKYELGQDAVIIDQKMVRTGKWYNIFKKRELEVTVALEENLSFPNNIKNNEVAKAVVDKNIDQISPNEKGNHNNLLLENIETDIFFKNSSNKVKEHLINYCKLYDKESNQLSFDEKKDFLNIVLKENSFDEKVHLSKINVLVGPTGVGKTTTIAKIAAREYLLKKKKVGLITMDTYRIGAVEQLKTYSNILGIPFEVADSPDDMVKKVKILSDCDIILVDTLGTSPKDFNKLEEIKNHLKSIDGEINTYLVFSISTDKDTIMDILQKYKELNYDALIITKLDEVSNMSNLWYFLENNLSPIQFFCHGQDVPDDIQEATLDNIFEYCEENFSV